MKILFTLVSLILCLGIEADATPLRREFQDIKLPTQKVLEHQSWAAPLTANTTEELSNVAGPTSASATTITTFAAQPDYARNLVLTSAGGTANDLDACVVTITGTSVNSKVISETFTFTDNTPAAKTGNKAFKTVTSVAFPANCESGGFSITWSLGTGTKFGLKRCMANAGDIIKDLLDGATATVGTYAVSATAAESNTVIFNTAPNGTHNYDNYYIQNYQCF